MPRFPNPVSACAAILLVILSLQVQAAGPNKAGHTSRGRHTSSAHTVKKFSPEFEEEATSIYEETGLQDFGLSKQAFEYAYKGYTYMLERHMLGKSNILSICDFSQSSRNKRLYIIDLDQRMVMLNTFVAHGRNSGGEFAHSFSNSNKSHKSSLGFFLTEHTYTGDHGLSLKIHGLEKGFNDKADRRAIVIHGSYYVGSDFLEGNKFNGRSFGCPAVPYDETEEVIELMKDGSCFFIYYPAKKYLIKSKIINN
jgi:hypothetical protein